MVAEIDFVAEAAEGPAGLALAADSLLDFAYVIAAEGDEKLHLDLEYSPLAAFQIGFEIAASPAEAGAILVDLLLVAAAAWRAAAESSERKIEAAFVVVVVIVHAAAELEFAFSKE